MLKKALNATLSATLLLTLAACAPTVTAQNTSTPSTSAPTTATPATVAAPAAKPSVQVAAAIANSPIVAGSSVTISGKGFVPGSTVTVKGDKDANLKAAAPYTVGADGSFSGTLTLPAGATLGEHVLNVQGSGQPVVEGYVTVVNDPKVPLSGAELYNVTKNKLTAGLYQVAYSTKNNVLWVTSAVGRQASPSALLKVDPQSLKVLQSYDVLASVAPDGTKGGGVYGVAVDDSSDTVWVTNTRIDGTSVYSQADGKLLKVVVSPKSHTREVVLDSAAGKAYVSNVGTGDISVIDTKIYALTNIKITDAEGSAPCGLALDTAAHRLYITDLDKGNLAVMDTQTNKILASYPIGTVSPTSVALDTALGRAYIASQESAELTVMNTADGSVVARVPTGVGALSVSVDPASHTVYVSNRGSGTVTVVDGNTNTVKANLATGSYPNHQTVVNGVLYAVNKSLNADDANGDLLSRIALK